MATRKPGGRGPARPVEGRKSDGGGSRRGANRPGAAAKGKPGAAGRPPRGEKAGAAPRGDKARRKKLPFALKAHAAARPSRNAHIIKAEAGMTLQAWIAMESGGTLSVRESKRLLESGICKVNGIVETFGSRVLEAGDAIDVVLPETRSAKKRLAALDEARIVHVDDALIVYDKPADLPVTPPDSGRGPSLLGLLAERWPEVRPVHRIDADTSGLVIFARSEAVQKTLVEAFKNHAVDKRYLALVRGQPRPEGAHRSYLVKVASGRGFERWVSHEAGTGQPGREAITHWKVEERVGYWGSLVEVRPETGRHHQIRIHMAELGHPLIGDVRYGDRKDPIVVPRHLLHAAAITLAHPVSGQELSLKARLPEDFRAAMDALRRA